MARNWKFHVGSSEGNVGYNGASLEVDGSCFVFVDIAVGGGAKLEVMSSMLRTILLSNSESPQSIQANDMD